MKHAAVKPRTTKLSCSSNRKFDMMSVLHTLLSGAAVPLLFVIVTAALGVGLAVLRRRHRLRLPLQGCVAVVTGGGSGIGRWGGGKNGLCSNVLPVHRCRTTRPPAQFSRPMLTTQWQFDFFFCQLRCRRMALDLLHAGGT